MANKPSSPHDRGILNGEKVLPSEVLPVIDSIESHTKERSVMSTVNSCRDSFSFCRSESFLLFAEFSFLKL